MILEGKTLVLCGVGTGLGSEIARAAVRDGANVMLGARTESQLEIVAKEIDPSGQRVGFASTDIGDDARAQALCQAAADRFGGVDGLVQIAALDAVFGGIEDGALEDWDRTFSTNVVGSVRMVRAALPHMKQRGGGSVVLIGSQAWALPSTPQPAYGASKGALMSAMYYMAKELGPHKVRVNTVVPTWMWGPPVELFVKFSAKQREISEDEVIQEITDKMPLGEIPADEDVAEAVVFFCSDRARMITGQSLLVNAGEYMP
jgi:NAD(P)-dependent dehydrogenase (short-subunit alcohol dehydrogenase family)